MNSAIVFVLATLQLLVAVTTVSSQETFRNPIIDGNSADPAVLRLGSSYYLTLSTQGETQITVYKSSRLTDFRSAETSVAFQAPENCRDVWASEMHEVDGQLYTYFAMNCGDHRMYAVQAEDPTNPMGRWGAPINMLAGFFTGGIDGSVLKHGNGRMYFAWATDNQIWIARMINATALEESKVQLREATSGWECAAGCVNEGPFFIYNNNVSYMVFSATTTWDANYCLGLMSIDGDKDPMVPSNWWYGDDRAVFWRNDEEDVYTTGHASFTTSPDGSETWMVYHGTVDTVNINGYRIARIEKITWGPDGRPVFPRPHGYNSSQPVPSGQV
jgi:GH43 family beta-xylosidase